MGLPIRRLCFHQTINLPDLVLHRQELSDVVRLEGDLGEFDLEDSKVRKQQHRHQHGRRHLAAVQTKDFNLGAERERPRGENPNYITQTAALKHYILFDSNYFQMF